MKINLQAPKSSIYEKDRSGDCARQDKIQGTFLRLIEKSFNNPSNAD